MGTSKKCWGWGGGGGVGGRGRGRGRGGNPEMDKHLIQGEVEILLVASCYWNCNKFWQYAPLCSRLYLTHLLVVLSTGTQ